MTEDIDLSYILAPFADSHMSVTGDDVGPLLLVKGIVALSLFVVLVSMKVVGVVKLGMVMVGWWCPSIVMGDHCTSMLVASTLLSSCVCSESESGMRAAAAHSHESVWSESESGMKAAAAHSHDSVSGVGAAAAHSQDSGSDSGKGAAAAQLQESIWAEWAGLSSDSIGGLIVVAVVARAGQFIGVVLVHAGPLALSESKVVSDSVDE